MAAKTPAASAATSGFVEPNHGLYGGVNAVDAALITNGTHQANRSGLRHRAFYFADIDNTDTWTSGLTTIVAVAWQPDQADTDLVGATLTTAATGVVTFAATNANSNGWLHVWTRG